MEVSIFWKRTKLEKVYRFGGGAALLSRFRGAKVMLESLLARCVAARASDFPYIPGLSKCQSGPGNWRSRSLENCARPSKVRRPWIEIPAAASTRNLDEDERGANAAYQETMTEQIRRERKRRKALEFAILPKG